MSTASERAVRAMPILGGQVFCVERGEAVAREVCEECEYLVDLHHDPRGRTVVRCRAVPPPTGILQQRGRDLRPDPERDAAWQAHVS